MIYWHIYIIAWFMMCAQCRHEKFVINKNIGPVHAPYTYKHKDFEIIFPKRVHSNSEHLTYAMQHHFVDQDQQSPPKPNDDMHLIVPIGGKDHHLELRPSRNIFSPGALVETFKHTRKSHIRRPSRKNRSCHFTGKIRGRRKSRAALSTCNGLSGYIQTDEGLFMIEPQHQADHSADRPHPHVVYAPRKKNEANLYCAHDADLVGGKWVGKRNTDLLTNIPELHIETLVVLDQTLLRYHKDIDIENYVLTVFNIAHNLFHDSTLGVNINLAIVRLIRLEVEDHEMNIAMNHNIEKSLQYFRHWQQRINPKEDTHPNHHDMAVLLTRIDICGNDKTCGFVGAARFSGMCDPENQAVIAQDTGLLLGYTIAHEIGHTLNMVHDEKPFEIDIADRRHASEEMVSTVMSPHISDSVVEWSNCSHQRLKQFIDYGLAACMFDEPTEHSFAIVDELPGVMYDGDHQCREFFGPNSALCMSGVECDNLICYVEDKGCIETHTSPAEGTACGENKWCFHGKCIEVGERTNAVHGEWSPWSEWSECTRTCGSGVSSQRRHCNNPQPKFGGRFCDGASVRYKVCITEPCDPDAPTFRDVQCAEFNSWLYPGDGKVHQWKSYPIHDENPCALYCISEDGNIASLRPRVIDGTTCYRSIRDICIDGLCKEIPCDLDLQSSAVEDRCGVCKGDGSTCDVVRGEQEMLCIGLVSPEKQIMTIPAGAVNVKIEEMLPSETRIQVRDKSGTAIYIDGEMLGMYNVHGTRAWVGMIRTKQEAISIKGPLNETISIWANVQQNSTLRYIYGVPVKVKRQTHFGWDYLDWTPCSAECGPGESNSIAKCVEKIAGLVDKSFCSKIPQPNDLVKPCELAPCTSRWFVGDWGECLHCPTGSRSRIVKCFRPIGTREGGLNIIPDNECASNKPKTSESCTCLRDKREDTTSLSTAISIAATSPIVSTTQSHLSTTIINTKQQPELSGNETTATTLTIPTEETDDLGLVQTETIPTQTTQVTPKIDNRIEFMNLKHIRLTIHTELESGKYPQGLPHAKNSNDTSYDLYGKEALKFMNKMQHNFSNNKTKI